MPHRLLLLAFAFAIAACGSVAQSPRPAVAAGEWLEFEGSWNGVGSRRTISLGEGRVGSIVELKGSMLLAGANRPGVGFHSEVIGLVDSATGFQGRSVWTDERGDQVFSTLEGQGIYLAGSPPANAYTPGYLTEFAYDKAGNATTTKTRTWHR